MPWIYNPTRDVLPVTLQDGSKWGFLPRKKVYIQPENMSAEVWRLIQASKLANQGGDPPVARVPVIPTVTPPVPVAAPVPDTSSAHHTAGASFAVDSSNADHGEKDQKAVKKQLDDLGKATSEKSEPDLKRDTKTEKRGVSSRKRT
jgi:hypothetical protein